ncbi:MAG: glycosyltransferase family 2 protein [Prevotella sp.]|nr:glycosyltransferase family 2 protein [Prevotella sp.]
MDITVTIITINFNGLADTCALIDTIPFSDSLEVIVVDNGSARDEASEIERRYPAVRVIRSKENLGFAGGNNLGIQAARGKYVFLLNNDTVLKGSEQEKQRALQELANRLGASATIGAVCPKIRFAWGSYPIQFAGYTPLSAITLRNSAIGFGEEDKGQYDTAHPTPYAHGAAMMVKREAIEKAGLMPECFFLYYEELDWSMMLRRVGYEIWYDPSLTVYHKESRATGQNSPFKTYYVTRSRLLFAKRNLKGFSRLLSLAYLVCVAGLKGVLSSLLKGRADLAKATLRGIVDFTKL